jgi:hypothetical protein
LKFTAESAANPAQRKNLSAAGATKVQKEDSSVYPNHPKQKTESKEKNKGRGNTRFANRCPPKAQPKRGDTILQYKTINRHSTKVKITR